MTDHATHVRDNIEGIAGAWRGLASARSETAELAFGERIETILAALAGELGAQREARSRHFEERARDLVGVELRFGMVQIVSELSALRDAVLESWRALTAKDRGAAPPDAMAFDQALDDLLVAAIAEHTVKQDDAMSLSLAVIGHDLRNSLGAISMSSTVLSRSGNLPAELAKPANGILATVARMKGLVNDLVDLSRVRVGKMMPIAPAPADLEGVCRQVLEELQAVNSDFAIRFSAQGDLKGDWDAARVGQALSNLVAYAVQYGSFGEPFVVRAEGRADELVLCVSNRGTPTPAPLDLLFDPLLQLRPYETAPGQQPSGFRLGLYIAREIAAAHGGTLEARASEDQGTTFAMRLPRSARHTD
jgi:signal transduction histidine kinase